MNQAGHPLAGSLQIYHAAPASTAVLNLSKLSTIIGVTPELIDLELRPLTVEEWVARLTSAPSVLDIDSLVAMIDTSAWRVITKELALSGGTVLALATRRGELQAEVLNILSQGGINAIPHLDSAEFVHFPTGPGSLAAELCGNRYHRSQRAALALEIAAHDPLETVMEFNPGQSSFVRVKSGSAKVFVWTTYAVFDLDRTLASELEFEEGLDEYIPAIIFLRSTFGNRCWHNPHHGANLTIDDPLLTRRYGQIDFPELLRLADELKFHVTLAFIPWNHWRTRERNIRRYFGQPAAFSLCAHGCDHSKNEFRSPHYADLLTRSHLAAERMDRQQQRTGMPWDRLMVCPREDYSVEALQAFADSGQFLGLSNTGCIPRDMASPVVRGSDLLLPALDAFYGFPIFKRHYCSNIAAFAMSAFLGKPVILVEHHAYFRDNNRLLQDFLNRLKTTCRGLHWSGLADLARQSCQVRRIALGMLELRFFTDEFLFQNPDSESSMVYFLRRMPPDRKIESISVNGVPISLSRKGDFICFVSKVDGSGTVRVSVNRTVLGAGKRRPRGGVYQAGIGLRRWLTEFRDNWLSGNSLLLGLANWLMYRLRLGSCNFKK